MSRQILGDVKYERAPTYCFCEAHDQRMLWVDGNRGDTYTEDGCFIKPYKTIAAALAVALADSVVSIIPKTGGYTEDITVPASVSLVGAAGLAATITGDVTITSGNPISIKGIRFAGDAKTLTINSVVSFIECFITCAVVINSTTVQAYNTHIISASGVTPLTVNGTSQWQHILSTIASTGNAPAIRQNGGMILTDLVKITGSRAGGPVVSSVGGQFLATSTQIFNMGGGAAADLQNGAVAAPNMLQDVFAVGNIVCGTAVTCIEGVQFAAGALTGTMLQYRAASMIKNVPAGTVAATDVQAAINELDTDKLAKNAITTSFLSGDVVPKTVTVVDGQITSVV